MHRKNPMAAIGSGSIWNRANFPRDSIVGHRSISALINKFQSMLEKRERTIARAAPIEIKFITNVLFSFFFLLRCLCLKMRGCMISCACARRAHTPQRRTVARRRLPHRHTLQTATRVTAMTTVKATITTMAAATQRWVVL